MLICIPIFINIWHDVIHRSKVLLCTIPKLRYGFEVKVTDLDFSYKCQSFCLNYKDSLVFVMVIFTGICYGDSYRSKVLVSMIPASVSYL